MEVLEGHRVNVETLKMRQVMEHEIVVIFLPSQTYVDTRIQTDTDTKQSNVTDNRFLLLYLIYCAHTLIFSRSQFVVCKVLLVRIQPTSVTVTVTCYFLFEADFLLHASER